MPESAHAQSPSPASAPPKLVDIWEIDVEGNSVLDEAAIDEAIEPYLGPGKTTEDVDRAREVLERLYRERGYKTVTVSIPRQKVRDGVVRLKVVEGRVGHLTVVGSKYHSIDRIKQQAPSVAEGTVPNFNEVQRDIVELNQQPDRRVTPSLKAGAAPGTVDLDLVVDDHLPLHGSLELNNRRSQDTSELRALASLSYDNLWQRGHSFTLSYQIAPQNPSDARVLFASYLARFSDSPFSLLVNGIKSDSNVATVGGTNVIGKGQVAGLRGVLALPSTETFYDSVTFGVDYKHFRNRTALGGQFIETPVTYYPLTLAYTAIFRFPSSITQADISVNFASPKLGSTTADLDNNRFLARGQQFYFKAALSRSQDLPFGLQGYVRINGQVTDQPLITNEQFSGGGVDTVRGYLEAEVLGDYGYNGSFELRSPPLADHFAIGKHVRLFQELSLFGFTDGARLQLHSPLPGQESSFSLASVGAGINLKFPYLNSAVVWADPAISSTATRAWSSRVLFRVWSSF